MGKRNKLSNEEQEEILNNAIKDYKKSLETYPDDSEILYELDKAQRKLEDLSDVIRTNKEYRDFIVLIEDYNKEKKKLFRYLLLCLSILFSLNTILFLPYVERFLEIDGDVLLILLAKVSLNAPIIFLLWDIAVEYSEVKSILYQYKHKLTSLTLVKNIIIEGSDKKQDFLIQEYNNIMASPKIRTKDYSFNVGANNMGFKAKGNTQTDNPNLK